MENDIKGYNLIKYLIEKNDEFSKIIIDNIYKGKIRFFDEREWDLIKKQNFIAPENCDAEDFYDYFIKGYNIGDCIGTSRRLSFSYNDVDIVSGILPVIKGTLNAEQEGGHGWLETSDKIIDTSLLLVIDKDLKNKLGYIEESRLTHSQLIKNIHYVARQEFVNDNSIRRVTR